MSFTEWLWLGLSTIFGVLKDLTIGKIELFPIIIASVIGVVLTAIINKIISFFTKITGWKVLLISVGIVFIISLLSNISMGGETIISKIDEMRAESPEPDEFITYEVVNESLPTNTTALPLINLSGGN